MKWVLLIFKWLFFLLIFLFIAVVVVAHQIKFYPTDKTLKKQFTDKGFVAPVMKTVETTYGPITLIDNERESNLPVVVFLHGSPGSSTDFRLYFQDSTLQDFRILSLNRLGFAKKNYGKIDLDLTHQAISYIEAVEQIVGGSKIIWVGHSYGGAPAAVSASLANENTVGLILAAAPIDPDLEKKFWFNKLAQFPPVYWILPTTLKMAQKEKMSHSRELQKVEYSFETIECPTYVLQGDQDFMSPMGNVDYAEQTFKLSRDLQTRRIEGQSHFFPFQGRENVTNAILDLAQK